MKSMKKSAKLLMVGGGLCALAVAYTVSLASASASVLDGFSINTQEKAVTVTLFTDQKARYTTDSSGKQFTITLPESQLSKKQLENGLPVVIDNKNHFIGRAVPTGDGHVKIILPNIASDRYTVTVNQLSAQQSTAPQKAPALEVAEVSPSPQPRAAIKATPDSEFEQIAEKGSTPVVHATPTISDVRQVPLHTASSWLMKANEADNDAEPANAGNQTTHMIDVGKMSAGTIWNPYVIRKTTASSGAHPLYKVVPQTERTETTSNTLAQPEQAMYPTLPAVSAYPAPTLPHDPLAYLHALTPGAVPAVSGVGYGKFPVVEGPLPNPASIEGVPSIEDTSGNGSVHLTPQSAPKAQPPLSLWIQLTHAMRHLPFWFWLTGGLFLTGVGLFGLIGALVLLRVLFSQVKPGTYMPAVYPFPMNSGITAMDMPNSPDKQALPEPVTSTKTAPSEAELEKDKAATAYFKDTASVNALDYLNARPSPSGHASHPSPMRHLSAPSLRRARSKKAASF